MCLRKTSAKSISRVFFVGVSTAASVKVESRVYIILCGRSPDSATLLTLLLLNNLRMTFNFMYYLLTVKKSRQNRAQVQILNVLSVLKKDLL